MSKSLSDFNNSTVAVDAMGGDKGPEVVVEAVVEAQKYYGGKYIIVGDQKVLEPLLNKFGAASNKDIKFLHAKDVVTMDDSPVEAVREKTDSSLVVAARTVRAKKADALVSPGNTGAVLAAGTLILGRIHGLERPGIAIPMPTATGYSVLIDAGANVDSKAIHLLNFAVMGSIYAQTIINIPSPRIGLLSIGEEESKGNELTRESFPLFDKTFKEKTEYGKFIGNVEGRDIANGKCHVIVCDGFTGNVVLKFGEGLAFTIIDIMKQRLLANPLRRVATLILKRAFAEFKKKIDYTEYGGAPLLGVRSPCIICHGSSNKKALRNALRVALLSIDQNICGKIQDFVKCS